MVRRSAPHLRNRSRLALLAAGGVCILSTLVPAVTAGAASAEPGSSLGSFNLSASAPAVQFRQQEPTYCFATPAGANGCEGVVPEAVATLRNGPSGHALSAVVWPGALAASAGSLLITAGGDKVPDSARTLNDPVKAEAYNSTGDPTVRYDQVPGTTMTATALDDKVVAEASVSQSQALPIGTFGRSTGKATTVLTGPSLAVATAHSEVQDITLAGVVHIASVISDAKASTDGTKAVVVGKTIASGITIAGIPVTIDGNGVTVMGSNLPSATAQSAVNSALASAGMTVAMGTPDGRPDGASATYNAGSLAFVWKQQAGYTMTAVLGGANVSVVAAPALDFGNGGVVTVPTTEPGTTPAGTSSGGTSAPAPQLPGVTVPGSSAPAPSVATPVLAASKLKLPGGLSPALGLLGVAGTGLIAFGLKRLPDRLLETTAPTCLLEEST